MNKIVVMFPGQASQYVGMGKSWYDRYESVRQRFAEASEVLGVDLADLCFKGPANELTKTENTQPALLTLSVAMFEVLQREEGLQPSYVAGHSIGELSALTAAGVFTFADAVRVARARGQAMASCDTGAGAGMSAVTKVKASIVESVLEELGSDKHAVEVANYNSPTQTVLSGSLDGLQIVGERLKELGAKVIPLNVSGPFHSRYMGSASDALQAALEPISLGDMTIPVMCGLEGRLYTQEDDIKAALVAQLTGPVRWTSVVSQLSTEGIGLWLEVGPKGVLKNLTLQTVPSARAFSYDEEDDQELIVAQLESIKKNKLNAPHLIGLCLGAAVCTRNHNWDEAAYQKGVVEPYKEINSIQELVEGEGRKPTQEEMSKALSLLKGIFQTKGTPVEEQRDRFRQILKSTETDELFPGYLDLVEEGS